MANYNISINLTALHNACVTTLKGKQGVPVKCVIIPVADNNLIEGKNGVYLSANAWETEGNQYGNSHMIKLSATKEQRATLPKDQLNAYQCILGNAKPIEFIKKNEGSSTPAPVKEVAAEDLPW